MAEGNENGTNGADWRASLPETIRNDPSLKDFKDISSIAQSYIETKKLVGASLRPPGEDAGPEARTEFLGKLKAMVPELVPAPQGEDIRPKEAKEYTPPAAVDLPPQALEQLRVEAEKEGLTKRQFAQRARRLAEHFETITKAQADARAALKVELGNAFEERTALVAASAQKLGFPAALIAELRAGQVDLPTFKAFATIAKSFSEGGQGAMQGNGGNGNGMLTPGELDVKMAEIRANPDYLAGSKVLRAKMVELSKQRWPEK